MISMIWGPQSPVHKGVIANLDGSWSIGLIYGVLSYFCVYNINEKKESIY